MRRLSALLSITILVAISGLAASPRPVSACSGYLTTFTDAVPHAASIFFASVIAAPSNVNGINRVTFAPGRVVMGAPRTHVTPIRAANTCNGITAGEDGVVVIPGERELGTPTEWGVPIFFKIGHPFGTSRAVIDAALNANDLPDTATAPPGADDLNRPHSDPGAWPMLVFILGLFTFMLVLRLSRPRPGGFRQGRTSRADRTRSDEPPAVTTRPPSA